MFLRFTPLLFMLLCACVLAVGEGPARAASPVCSATGYAYAGYEGGITARGVAATISEIAPTEVGQGQVLAWIGVGSEQGGSGGKPEWIQAGLIVFPGQSAQLYYEIARPGQGWKRTLLGSPLTAGESHRITVAETSRNRWQVSVDGAIASPRIFLPDSHGSWVPNAVVESYKDDPGTCNSYNFDFRRVSFRSLGSSWKPARAAYIYRDHGASVTKKRDGFTVSARL